jgi:hypothetical protein
MDAPGPPRKLKQFVLKPTVFCYHRCPYCDPRQDYYRDMISDRKKTLPLACTASKLGASRLSCDLLWSAGWGRIAVSCLPVCST